MTAFPACIVFIQGIFAGTLEQKESGQVVFTYDMAYRGAPLSLNMPIANTTYGDKVVRPYLFGLLPDDFRLCNAIGREFGVSGNDPFALLSHIGEDCPGAVQIIRPDKLDSLAARKERYEPLDNEEIAQRFREIDDSSTATWQTANEHWSLGGQQAKIALARFDGAWYSCESSAATTHILKPGIRTLKHQALNEHLCLRLADLCNVRAAESEHLVFDGMPAIAVRRFDRIAAEPFSVQRLHQEDLCQALGVLPENKYAESGGPSATDILRFFDAHPGAKDNKAAFAAQLFFNYLIGAPDAHAKNYSVLLGLGNGPMLSPLYDVASALPYDMPRKVKLAMSIGGENHVGHLRRTNLQHFAESAQLGEQLVFDLMGNLAEAIIEKLPALQEEAGVIEEAGELLERMLPPTRELCEKTLAMVEQKSDLTAVDEVASLVSKASD